MISSNNAVVLSYDGQNTAPIFAELQGIRNDVLAESSFMLRESSVGIGLVHASGGTGTFSNKVQTLSLGSPAHLSGAVSTEDEVCNPLLVTVTEREFRPENQTSSR